MSLTGVPDWRNAYFRCLSLWFWKECSSAIKPKDCHTFCVSIPNNSLVRSSVVFWWRSSALLWVHSEVTLVKGRTEGREACPQKPAAWLGVTQMGTKKIAGETCIHYSNAPLSGRTYNQCINARVHITFSSIHTCLPLLTPCIWNVRSSPFDVSGVLLTECDTHRDQTSWLRILIHLSVFLQRG